MEHTKGPWRIRINKNDDQDTCNMSICGDIFVIAVITGPQYPHQVANARLISSAPDLLEALQEVVNALEGRVHSNPALLLGKAKDAIAKAIGGA